jgi:hypothetical protein
MQLLSLLEAFRNGFTKPNVRHFTLLVVSLCALPSITGCSVSPVHMWAESQLTQHWNACGAGCAPKLIVMIDTACLIS